MNITINRLLVGYFHYFVGYVVYKIVQRAYKFVFTSLKSHFESCDGPDPRFMSLLLNSQHRPSARPVNMLTYMNPSKETVSRTWYSDESVTHFCLEHFTSVTLVPLTEDISAEQDILH
jgi:hypothetical protein